MKEYIAIVSDDLTGANDSGVQLIESGIYATVLFDVPSQIDANNQHIVINTNTRILSREDAKKKTKQAGELLQQSGYEIVYKKMDSTLRGYPGTELKVLQEIFDSTYVFIAPAYPDMGRITKNGVHYVDGKKISETEFSQDPKHPIRESSLVKMIEHEINDKVGLITERDYTSLEVFTDKLKSFSEAHIRFIVCDATKQHDLEVLANYITSLDENILWAGSAGLAQEWGKIYRSKTPQQNIDQITATQTLTICGSLSDITQAQIEYAIKQRNIKGIELDTTQVFKDSWKEYKERVVKEMSHYILNGFDIVLYLPGDRKIRDEVEMIKNRLNVSSYKIGNMISQALSSIVISTDLITEKIDGFVLTGGDTANDIIQSLGGMSLQLIKEIELGIPLGILNAANGKFPVVTKAGAFGQKETVYNAIQVLKGADNNGR